MRDSGLRRIDRGMNVELAEERILLLPDKLGAAQAEGRAWSKRTDAFGAFADEDRAAGNAEMARVH